jgi:hypothetical protein
MQQYRGSTTATLWLALCPAARRLTHSPRDRIRGGSCGSGDESKERVRQAATECMDMCRLCRMIVHELHVPRVDRVSGRVETKDRTTAAITACSSLPPRPSASSPSLLSPPCLLLTSKVPSSVWVTRSWISRPSCRSRHSTRQCEDAAAQ